MVDEPITEEWLKQAGFKWHQVDRQPSKHWLLWIGGAFLSRRNFSGSDDLGIEVAHNADDDWFCWLRCDTAHRYHRFIHIRHLQRTSEIEEMIKGLIGYPFDPANCFYGSLRRPEDAESCRKEDERLDRLFMRGCAKWAEIEKDDTRGQALPDHYEEAEKARTGGKE